ncbi:FecR family protein [Flavobacterium flavipallidum]|uniref:FecR family protein n=1 Tax=Flavobacterium flavipallidum TaxID=3139140 RepID=A0ABU9HLU1_9FLAO
MEKKIKKAHIKFLMNELEPIDFKQLEDWLSKEGNNEKFEEYIKVNYLIDLSKNLYDKEKAKELYFNKIKEEKTRLKRRKLISRMSYAAAALFIGVLTISYVFKFGIFSFEEERLEPIIVNNQITPGSNKAILTLENGKEVALTNDDSYVSQNAESDGKSLVYKKPSNSKPDLVYNYLTIPRGGQFLLEMIDGTKIWLNSETKLKFPVNLKEGESRKVELLYGEIYLEVSPSSKHNGADFVVTNNVQEIKVLGTKFNVKAYQDENKVFTTLAEGKVAINYNGVQKLLSPDQQSVAYKNNENIIIKNINSRKEIAWVNGEFILEHKSLYEIMKVLARWYDMDVVFTNKNSGNIRFVGVLGKDQDIITILNTIKSFGAIKNYEIHNKTITLK